MKCFFLFAALFDCAVTFSQNVGIGTTSPAEKLDVNGNANISGQLKLNGNTGTSGQVLMKDAGNNPVWGDISEFKNIMVFDCSNVAPSASANNCSASWVVPANITKILVECWGGGGGGGMVSGAGGGGYITARFTVTPGTNANLQIGAGGASAAAPGIAGTSTGITGGVSFFSISGAAIFASGGSGAITYGALAGNISARLPSGGSFSISGLGSNYFGIPGASGIATKESFYLVTASQVQRITNYGNGGDAAMTPGSGAMGGTEVTYGGRTISSWAENNNQQGGGGAADSQGGTDGKGGRIIIHY